MTEVTVLPDVTREFSDVANQTLLCPLTLGDGFNTRSQDNQLLNFAVIYKTTLFFFCLKFLLPCT